MGAASLIRANPVFVLAIVALFAVIALRSLGRRMLGHLVIFSVGFLVLFSPWLVTGVNESGVPWFWVKFQFVVGQRFQSRTLPPDLDADEADKDRYRQIGESDRMTLKFRKPGG